MCRTALSCSRLAGAAMLAGSITAAASAETLRLVLDGVVDSAVAADPSLASEIGAGDRFRWEQLIELDAPLVASGRGTTASAATQVVAVTPAALTLRPERTDALRFDFDGDVVATDDAGAAIGGFLTGELVGSIDDRGLIVAGRDDHPLHPGWTITATIEIEGLAPLTTDDRQPISGARPNDTLPAVSGTIASGNLYAFNHLTRRHHWIATLGPAVARSVNDPIVVPLPAGAALGLAGLGLVARLRRRA